MTRNWAGERAGLDDYPYRLPHPAKLALLAGSMLALTLAVTLASAAQNVSEAGLVPDAQRRIELVRFVRHDCGSCHGLTLGGGLGPPLTAAALAPRTSSYLTQVILRGRNGTAMPGWSPFVSDAEARWIADQLLRGFPDANN